jgi:hypothetical protein
LDGALAPHPAADGGEVMDGVGREMPDLPPGEYQGWTTGNILPYIGYEFIRFEWASPPE